MSAIIHYTRDKIGKDRYIWFYRFDNTTFINIINIRLLCPKCETATTKEENSLRCPNCQYTTLVSDQRSHEDIKLVIKDNIRRKFNIQL